MTHRELPMIRPSHVARPLACVLVAIVAIMVACVGEDPGGSGPEDAGATTEGGQVSAADGQAAAADGQVSADASTEAGDSAAGCLAPRTLCGAACVDLQTSPDHCGACSSGCGTGSCMGGACPSRLVFVTAQTYNGNLGAVDGADTKCGQAAAAAGLRGRYKAWISGGPGVSAVDRLEHAAGAYKLPSGTQVAVNWDNLVDDSLDVAINETERGLTPPGEERVWTGTLANGTTSNLLCVNWISSNGGGDQGRFGNRTAKNADWSSTIALASCDSPLHLYCVEQR